MNKLAIIGGSGSIGKFIGLKLDSSKYEVTSFDFKHSDVFQDYIIDKNNLSEFVNTLKDFSYCIIAIQKQLGTKNIDEFELINTTIPVLISNLENFKKIVYVTTALIVPEVDNDIFSRTVMNGENTFIKNQKEKNYTIIRPGNLINSKIPNYFTNMISRLQHSKIVFYFGNKDLKIQFTTLEDLANYVVYCISNNTDKDIQLHSSLDIELYNLISQLKVVCNSSSKLIKIPKFITVILLKLLALIDKNYYPQIRIRALLEENISNDFVGDAISIKKPIEIFVEEYNLND